MLLLLLLMVPCLESRPPSSSAADRCRGPGSMPRSKKKQTQSQTLTHKCSITCQNKSNFQLTPMQSGESPWCNCPMHFQAWSVFDPPLHQPAKKNEQPSFKQVYTWTRQRRRTRQVEHDLQGVLNTTFKAFSLNIKLECSESQASNCSRCDKAGRALLQFWEKAPG